QRSLASFLRDNGVDLIIGGHPHVIQHMELTDADSTGRRILTVYSLGNFISNMRTTDTRGGAMVKVVLRRSPDGLPAVHSAEYALVFTVPAGSGQSNYRLYPIDSDSIPSAWRSRASAFASSARRIFSAHNHNVKEVSAR
ncbi:MAG: CapA family protein, partial [Muribaculaceae bacterium]|nr:CapA family protein [Muribaculaceae bacterium]